jgi:4-diphosphocytidyl-2-C-methyl-D-erythritol kinase
MQPAGPWQELAPAKINLTLHIRGRRADGYHELESLVAFADLADTLCLQPDAPLALDVTGPTARGAGPLEDNLVLKAVEALVRRAPGIRLGAFKLTKQLPVAAGIGGGSSDAAAALRLLARLNGLPLHDLAVVEAARAVGADVPVCLEAQARLMRGAGERLGRPLTLPPLLAVLVNPGRPLSTEAVFRRLGVAKGQMLETGAHVDLDAAIDIPTLIAVLAGARNDLQPAAVEVEPVIAEVIEAMRAQEGCQIARMSGSGATCFALFGTLSQTFDAVRNLRRKRSRWWVQPAILGGRPNRS